MRLILQTRYDTSILTKYIQILIDQAGLGRACTSVVTEYRLRKQEHTAKYTIEIDRMSSNEIEEQLNELLWSYRLFHIADVDKQAEDKKLADRSELAWDTLQAAFGSKEQLTEAYLRDESDGAEKKIQRQLKIWADELQWPVESFEDDSFVGANTIGEYKSKLREFLGGNLWPFIKVIR